MIAPPRMWLTPCFWRLSLNKTTCEKRLVMNTAHLMVNVTNDPGCLGAKLTKRPNVNKTTNYPLCRHRQRHTSCSAFEGMKWRSAFPKQALGNMTRGSLPVVSDPVQNNGHLQNKCPKTIFSLALQCIADTSVA